MSLVLSEADRNLLRLLVDSDGRISSNELSRQLRVPTSSIARARERLEQAYITKQYSLDPTKFGWHRIDLPISIRGGQRTSLVKILSKM
jgi:DNA-binding Lrp family transcriptional regulator